MTPTTPEALLAQLEAQNIPFVLYHHPAFFTVEEGLAYEKDMPGAHGRNLFLRDKKGRMALVSALNETKIDLKKLAPLIGCDRLSFGSPERLWAHLGVTPGSVCPFAVVNDPEHQVNMVLDAAILRCNRVHFHPLINTMTVGLGPKDLVKFLEKSGHPPHICDLTLAAPD